MTGRRILGIAVVAVWVGMFGWMVRDQYFQPESARLAEAARSLPPGVQFYELRMGDRSVGLATSRLDTLPDGFVLEDFMSLELPALGQTGTAVTRARVELSRSLAMKTFSFSMDSEVGTFRAAGAVRGDTLLEVEVDGGGREAQSLSYRLDEPPVFSAVLPIRVAVGGGLEVGEDVRLPIFDPSTLSTREVEIRVLEHDTLIAPDSAALDPATGRWSAASHDTIPAWRIAQVYGGVELESWIDEDGRVVRASSPMGFSMERTEYELARQAQEASRGLGGSPVDDDVILSTAIESRVDPAAVRGHDMLRFRLGGVDLDGFDLDGGRQELRGDTLVVRREDPGTLQAGYTLPYKRMDLGDALRPEPLIQSDDERIVEEARRLAGVRGRGPHDPEEAVRRLNRGVHDLLEKEITFSVPSAVQVLESRQGDCNEHTVLFVAMARALGIPARTAVGLVWVDGAFYYHAWPEVWLDGWVAVDPTLGQYPADASHIRFVVGGLAQQVEIVRLIGRLEIDLVEDEVARGPGGSAAPAPAASGAGGRR